MWEAFSATEDAHPIHLHLVAFQILNREGFEGEVETEMTDHGTKQYLTDVELLGDLRDPEPNERGSKDTAVILPGEVTRIVARFDRPGPLRLALPHPLARGPRDDAALPRRPRGWLSRARRCWRRIAPQGRAVPGAVGDTIAFPAPLTARQLRRSRPIRPSPSPPVVVSVLALRAVSVQARLKGCAASGTW